MEAALEELHDEPLAAMPGDSESSRLQNHELAENKYPAFKEAKSVVSPDPKK